MIPGEVDTHYNLEGWYSC